jgi:hypothetical protein
MSLVLYLSRIRFRDLLARKRPEPFFMVLALLGNVRRYDIGALVEYSNQVFTRR